MVLFISAGFAEASVTVFWDQTTTNSDGSVCTDLAGYRLYYDTDGAGAPYNGTGLTEGDSPISVTVTSLSDPANPEFVLSGLTADVTYHLAVTSYDTSGNESGYSNEVTVTETAAVNHAPTASAGSDQTVAQSQLSGGSIQINLDGSGSSDPDGDSLTYSWVEISGGTVNLLGSTTATPFFSLTSALSGQTLVFQLTVSDGQASSTDTVRVVVEQAASPGNAPPTASASATPTQGEAPLSVRFYGLGIDTDGTIDSYAWSFGDGDSGSGAAPTHTYTASGTYTATLTVTDDQGATDIASVSIVVTDRPNVLPTASISADTTSGLMPLTINFTANASDSDGTVTRYVWDFGDQSSSYTANPSHIFATSGRFTVSLRVTDNDGGETTVEKTITVYDPEMDSDEDGLTNGQEFAYGLNPGVTDSDGDGISDFVEWGAGDAPIDTDADGTIDALDLDSDNDGKPDVAEGTNDADKDGALNYIDMDDADGPTGDQDMDGILNIDETTYGLNPNLSDSDHDDASDLAEWGSSDTPADTDADGVVDALDTDSDDDGVSDLDEDGVDSDQDGTLDRVDNQAATMATPQGKMSVVINHPTARLAQTEFIETVVSSGSQPNVSFPYGGVEYQIAGISVGEIVLVTIVMPDVLPDDAEYWKYDDNNGFRKLTSQVSGNQISFALADGGTGDDDGMTNGLISDPGYVGIPQAASVSDTVNGGGDPGSSGGGGGGGCALSRRPGNPLDLWWVLLPPVFTACRRKRPSGRV